MQSVHLEQKQNNWHGTFKAMASPCEVIIETDDRNEAEQILKVVSAEAWRIESGIGVGLSGLQTSIMTQHIWSRRASHSQTVGLGLGVAQPRQLLAQPLHDGLDLFRRPLFRRLHEHGRSGGGPESR